MSLVLALATTLLSQAPDDLVLCTQVSDCPSGAVCEDGVCVLAADQPAPPPPPPPRRRSRRRRRVPQPGQCYRHYDCPQGQECLKRRCGPEIPSTGTGMLVGGSITSGVGALFLVLAPVCKIDNPNNPRTTAEENVCLGVNVSIGVVALGVGVPLIVFGILRRAEFKKWVKEYHPRVAFQTGRDKLALVGFDF